ncbi:MAG: 6-pyruvoyl tetrahydrobiopterin synthase [Nitrospirota bacterium]|jgi:6-pyruvoyltetrahydropterin/6-carboxytetrahydropterin synthase
MMAQASVTRRYRFCAAHRLHTDHLSPEENWAAFGKCNNPNGHGHNYVVLVTVKSPVSAATGRGVELDRLDRVVAEQIIARFDHHDLNQDPEFADCTTTGENLVLLIWDLLVRHLPVGQLQKVGLIETRDNYFEYAGSASQAPRLREGRDG